jgi:glycosyltransferase involved in cell wall biosynthesis
MAEFTIVIPTKNSEQTLKRTLDSLLLLHFKDFVILLVDGHSTDSTLDIFRKNVEKFANPPIIFTQASGTKGKQKGINDSFFLIKTPYFLVLDSDDTLDPDALTVAHETWAKLSGEYYSVRARVRLSNTMKTDGSPYPIDINKMPSKKALLIDYKSGFDKVDFFKTSLFKTFLFPENPFISDVTESLSLRALDKKYKVFFINNVLRTYYIENQTSLGRPAPSLQNSVNLLFRYSFLIRNKTLYYFTTKEFLRWIKYYLISRKSFISAETPENRRNLKQIDQLSWLNRVVLFAIFWPFYVAFKAHKM